MPRHTACTLGRGAATTRLTPCAAQHQRRQTRRQTRKQTPSPRRRLSSRSSRSMTPLTHATLTLTAAIDFDDSHPVDRDLTKEMVEKREPLASLGTKVQGLWHGTNGGKKWFEGKVTCVHADGTCNIYYHDGDEEEKVRMGDGARNRHPAHTGMAPCTGYSLNPHNGKDEQRKDRVLLLNVAD